MNDEMKRVGNIASWLSVREALSTVLDLARGNVLDVKNCETDGLEIERLNQLAAILRVENYLDGEVHYGRL